MKLVYTEYNSRSARLNCHTRPTHQPQKFQKSKEGPHSRRLWVVWVTSCLNWSLGQLACLSLRCAETRGMERGKSHLRASTLAGLPATVELHGRANGKLWLTSARPADTSG